MDCIHPRQDQEQFEQVVPLYIDPGTCIDCGARVPECPVTAIFPLQDVPDNWREDIDKSADRFNLSVQDYQAKWNEPGKTQ